jgi:hypothetical protein
MCFVLLKFGFNYIDRQVSKEIERQTFMDDMSFLRIRNLTLRCLAAAVDIACASESNSPDPKPQHQHHHANDDGPVINGEVKEDGIDIPHLEIFVRLSEELLNLYNSYTANPPAQVPQVRDTYFYDYYALIVFSPALAFLADR